MGFDKLIEFAAGVSEEDRHASMGELARAVGEPWWRLDDAVTALRVMSRLVGHPVTVTELRAATDPVVRAAVTADRGTVVTGAATAPFDMHGELLS
jgi:hypothetical protein